MKNYYEFISLTPQSSTEDVKKSIQKKKKEVSKMKIRKQDKNKMNMELKEIEFIFN